jgi:hypothetical protein
MESKVEYKVIEAYSREGLEAELNRWANQGWNADMSSLVVVNTSMTGTYSQWGYTVIMSKWSASMSGDLWDKNRARGHGE